MILQYDSIHYNTLQPLIDLRSIVLLLMYSLSLTILSLIQKSGDTRTTLKNLDVGFFELSGGVRHAKQFFEVCCRVCTATSCNMLRGIG